jgi:hypothetical protein
MVFPRAIPRAQILAAVRDHNRCPASYVLDLEEALTDNVCPFNKKLLGVFRE